MRETKLIDNLRREKRFENSKEIEKKTSTVVSRASSRPLLQGAFLGAKEIVLPLPSTSCRVPARRCAVCDGSALSECRTTRARQTVRIVVDMAADYDE